MGGRVYRVAGALTLLEFVNSVFPPWRIPSIRNHHTQVARRLLDSYIH